jgi:hypothetical protein
VNYFLITYNRRTGAHQVLQFGSERRDALQARFKMEREHRDDPDLEVVVLGSDSIATLEKTHPRYFRGLEELTAN